MFRLPILLSLVVGLGLLSGSVSAESRVALVIGNSNYGSGIGFLRNPENDARLMSKTLRNVGFDVIERRNVNQREMRRAIREFGQRLEAAGGQGVGLFYYAGHGVQANGTNYLIPVGSEIRSEADMAIEAVPARGVLAQMEHAGARVNIVVLDACRNNPFARGFRSANSGLARMDAPTGSIVAYSTAPGQVASDGQGRNSPYTHALSRAMQAKGAKLEEVFKSVRVSVMDRTNGQQVPWESSSLTGDFYFAGEAGAPAAQVASVPAFTVIEIEDTLYTAKRSNVRAGPGTKHPKIDRLDVGTEVEVTGRVDGTKWVRIVSRDGGVGFLYRPLLVEANPKKAKAPAAEPPAPVPAAQPKAAEQPSQTQVAVGVFPAQEPETAPSRTFRDCRYCPEMIEVPAGNFNMGSPSWENGRGSDEGPVHRVSIRRSFAVGVKEVTRREFGQFVNQSGHRMVGGCRTFENGRWEDRGSRSWLDPGFKQTEDDPAVCVNWQDAKAYVGWLSRRTGKRYRLLSEAEWEYAARGGTTTRYWYGDNPGYGRLCGHGNGAANETGFSNRNKTCADLHERTAPGGSYPANGFGLHDMMGNVWEWVEDCGTPNYQGAPVDGSAAAFVTGGCSGRALRGGAWSSPPADLRSANRDGVKVAKRSNQIQVPKFLQRLMVQVPQLRQRTTTPRADGTRASDKGFRVARTLP